MQTYRWKRVGTRLMSGLAACLMTASLFAQSPAAMGVVRISDRPQRSYAPSRQVQRTSLTRGQQIDVQRGYLLQPATHVSNSRSTQTTTGHPAVDLPRTASINNVTSTHYSSTSPCGEGCSFCQQGGFEYTCSSNLIGQSLDNVDRFLAGFFAFEHKTKRSLFGYFMPDGCCGQGCAPLGQYNMLYSANPNYFDRRDGRVYAAQGYGIPMAVPLAPNVRHTYNYGWGIPSSRLTPISTRAPF